jgi:uncharacterized protein with NRDE domain
MCLIAFAYRASQRFPLVIAANRDEYLNRPTAALSFWQSPQGTMIASGRDLQDGGTWMGFTAAGRFAMLTNVRNPAAPSLALPISRGQLALSWLDSTSPALAWIAQLDPQRYNGFNLVIGDWVAEQCFYLSNPGLIGINTGGLAIENRAIPLQPGHVYGLSNAALDTPWPKTGKLKRAVQSWLDLPGDTAAPPLDPLLAALADNQPAPDAQLPATGVPLELERALSSPFVRHPTDQPRYGTRSSLVALLNAQGQLQLEELTFSAATALPSRTQMQLQW